MDTSQDRGGARAGVDRPETQIDTIDSRLSTQIERAARNGERLQDFILRITGNNPMLMPNDRPQSAVKAVPLPVGKLGKIEEIKDKLCKIEALNESLDSLVGSLSAIG